jgi:rod shape determining protein RodA
MRSFIEFLKRFDYLIFIPVVVLLIISIFFVYSAGVNSYGVSVSSEWKRQIVWTCLGLGLYFGLTLVDYMRFRDLALPIYVVNQVLLLAVLVFGNVVSGARRWVGIGPFGGQPAELAKIGFILMVARFLSAYGRNPKQMSTLALSVLILSVPMYLTLKQPDFGTAMVFVAMLGIMLFMAGGNAVFLTFFVVVLLWFLILIFYPIYYDLVRESDTWLTTIFTTPYWLVRVIAVTSLIIIISFISWRIYRKWAYSMLLYFSSTFTMALGLVLLAHLRFKPYQWARLRTFINPYRDPLGTGWHILQSLTAVGSGGMYGRGYLGGLHSHNNFLPEQSTDFIFSVIMEETGFVGATIILSAYGLLLIRLLILMAKAADRFSMLVCGGTFTLLFIHIWINVGMTIGLMPIKGVPLFLLSYGGSSVLSMMILLGIVSSISLRQYR